MTLPDEVRAALTGEGISEDAVLLMTGDELRSVIGDRLTYELVVALAGQRLAVAHRPGCEGRIPQDDLIERNLDILKGRLVDGLNYKAIGREVGLTGSRVAEILRRYYGVDARPVVVPKTLTIPAASLPVVREAMRMALLTAVEDLHARLTAGEPDLSDALDRFDDARRLHEVRGDGDVTLYAGGHRGDVIADVLRRQLDTERDLADTHSKRQRDRAEANAATIERLLAAAEK